MKLELHILQNFAPSNLNRDDTGSPKDCELGGVRRARISSQCYKRAIRQAFDLHGLLDPQERATRTKRLVLEVAERVVKATGADPERAKAAVIRALGGVKLKVDAETNKTQYLLFLPARTMDQLANLVAAHIDALAEPASSTAEPPKEEKAPKAKPAKTKKQEKAEAKDDVPADLRKQIDELLSNGSRTPELALFGRMIADAPHWNVEAACQVAHAVSTHRVSMELDFYTAMDDLKREDTTGSDMMGTIPFNSACFYRYLVVDTADLARQLGGDAAAGQAQKTVEALLRASILAIPTGKQSSMAAHNPPSFVMVDVRSGAPRSLANAFVDPVRPRREQNGDLVAQSVIKLADFLRALEGVYGAAGRKELSYCVVDPEGTLQKAFADRVPGAIHHLSMDALVKAAVRAALGDET